MEGLRCAKGPLVVELGNLDVHEGNVTYNVGLIQGDTGLLNPLEPVGTVGDKVFELACSL